MNNSSSLVDRLVVSLNGAQTDNERLAALLLVSRCIKSEETSREERLQLFNAIGFRFVNRLLRTKVVSGEDDTASFYQSISLSVLSSFCTEPTLVVDPKMLSNVAIFNEIITSFPGSSESLGDARIVLDCYDCLALIAADTQGSAALSAADTPTALVQAIVQRCFGYQRAMELMSYLARVRIKMIHSLSTDQLERLLKFLAEKFQLDMSEQKFEICSLLSEIISALCSSDSLEALSSKDFWKGFNNCLFQLISSKLGSVQRDAVLRLISNIVKAYGLRWLVLNGSSVASGRSFLLLLIQLSSIEIRMTLDDCDIHNIDSDKQDVVASCCLILEDVQNFDDIDTVANLDGDQLEKVGGALMGAMRSIMSFIQYQHDHETEPSTCPVIFACVRLLGAWSSDEECAVTSEFTQLLPAIISICQTTYRNSTATSRTREVSAKEIGKVPAGMQEEASTVSTVGSVESSGVNEESKDSNKRVRLSADTDADSRNVSATTTEYSSLPELVEFMLPGLSHASSSEVSRGVISECNLIEFLVEYFAHKATSLLSVQPDHSKVQVDFFIHVCEILQQFLNDENSCLKFEKSFCRLAIFLNDTFNNTGLTRLTDNDLSSLADNVVLLSLSLLSKTFISSRTSLVEATRILNSSISLFCQIFTKSLPGVEYKTEGILQQTGAEETTVYISALKNLIDCVSVYPAVFTSSVQCGHLNCTIRSLFDVKEPKNVVTALLSGLEDILCAVISQSPQQNLLTSEEETLLVRTYKMNKLGTYLHR